MMYALDFSVNMLTLFGLVLAIGIVVDDAIVIVEAAAHHVERGMPPREATIKAMGQVLGPIIGITLVLLAVFIPSAFLGGITGQLTGFTIAWKRCTSASSRGCCDSAGRR
jgi:HAE1 family hydrophobic/amphiphilic exporter-1